MNKIDTKIINYKVVTETLPLVEEIKPPRVMAEDVPRDYMLNGATYKIKPPHENHAIYFTVNYQELDGVKYAREAFFESKDPIHKMWMTALALTISAVFRKGNGVKFLADQLKTVQSPQGYWGRKNKTTGKGVFYPSVIAEIGYILEEWLEGLNAAEYVPAPADLPLDSDTRVEVSEYPDNATVCPKCHAKAVVKMDGCDTCLECGESKCG